MFSFNFFARTIYLYPEQRVIKAKYWKTKVNIWSNSIRLPHFVFLTLRNIEICSFIKCSGGP